MEIIENYMKLCALQIQISPYSFNVQLYIYNLCNMLVDMHVTVFDLNVFYSLLQSLQFLVFFAVVYIIAKMNSSENKSIRIYGSNHRILNFTLLKINLKNM
jgi:hypothetical protein